MVSYLQPKTKSVRQIQTESFRRSKRIEHSITKKKNYLNFPLFRGYRLDIARGKIRLLRLFLCLQSVKINTIF